MLALAIHPLLDSSLVPAFKDRDLIVKLDAKPGTAQPVMTRIATQAARAVRALPGVTDAGAHIGRAVTGDQIVDVNSSELWVTLDSGNSGAGRAALNCYSPFTIHHLPFTT